MAKINWTIEPVELPIEPSEVELLKAQVEKLTSDLADTKDVIDFLIMS